MHPLRSVAVLLLLALACCGNRQKADLAGAQAGLQTALSAASTAARGFAQWDEAHQRAIAASATSEADARAKLSAYRTRREGVLLAFEAFEASVDAALAVLAATDPEPARVADAAAASLRAVLAVRQAVAILESMP